MKKRMLSVLLVLCMVLTLLPGTAFATDVPFSDVEADDWFYNEIQYAYENNLMVGVSSNKFDPNGALTRAMFVTILGRMSGVDEAAYSGASFKDVPVGEWYSSYIKWASDIGVVYGYGGGKFGPNDPVTREQMAAIIARYLTVEQYTLPGSEDAVDHFKDAETVVSWAKEGLELMRRTGIIVGDNNGNFNPKSTATRAEAATIFMKLHQSIEKVENFQYTVTFAMNDGSDTVYEEQTVSRGEKAVEPADPIREGYDFEGWFTDAALVNAFDFNICINSDIVLYAKWEEDNENYASVNYVLLIDEVVKNEEIFKSFRIQKGQTLIRPENPVSDFAGFVDWYADLSCVKAFDFTSVITEDLTLYAKWDVDITDSDQDGIFDVSEQYRGTDPKSVDTDKDGLTDYQELLVETDPLDPDTNKNGISDYDEDYDGDALTNGYEFEIGTNPQANDSDFDGLDDYCELYMYGTDPIKADTDGDGASDGWEIENGYDPLKYNESFLAKVEPDVPTEAVPVTAGAEVTVSGDVAASLNVEIVGTTRDYMLTPFIAGYLGNAYEFTIDGEFEKATITFYYDKSLGEIGDEFQPCIYYYNESDSMFEELEEQTVADGSVSAVVSHFSIYILLNKIEFDKAWETEIKPPDAENDAGVLDIAFVIDYSASMEDNDPNQIFKVLSKEFIAKLRDGIDRAAVIKFIRVANLLSGLTTDKDALNTAIDSITYDSGTNSNSGTDGSTGIKLALDELVCSESKYKYIIFITDGEDNGYTYAYDDLIETANTSNVIIYTVGMGDASETVLRKIADSTGGKYYHTTTAVGMEDVLNLDDVFDKIESETIDYTTDSNKDGISDYYTQLIFEGKLVLSNGSTEFEGVDFNYDKDGNLCDDFDGDGLKNGQELKIKHIKRDDGTVIVYIDMYSDPEKPHSDSDGVDDYEEYLRRSNPLKADYDGDSVGELLWSDWYYQQIVEGYEEDWVLRVEQALFGAGLTDGFEKTATKQLVNYFYNYVGDEQLEYNQAHMVAITYGETANEIISGLLKHIKSLKKALDKTSDIYGTISEADVLEQIRSAAMLIAEYKDIGSQLYDMSVYKPEYFEVGVVDAMLNLLDGKYTEAIEQVMELDTDHEILGNVYLKINDFTSKYKSFMDTEIISELTISDTLTLVDLTTDIADGLITVAKVNAATAAFEQDFDILCAIRANAKNEAVVSATQTVINAMGQGVSSYYEELGKVVVKEAGKALLDEIASTILKENPAYKGYKIAMSILKLTGADKTVENVYSILCYNDMIDATQCLCNQNVEAVKQGTYGQYYFYQVKGTNVTNVLRYLTNAAQMLMLANDAYIKLSNTDTERDELVAEDIVRIQESAANIKLPVSHNLIEGV